MERLKKRIIRIMIVIIVSVMFFFNVSYQEIQAVTDEKLIQEQIENYASKTNIDANNITKEDILKIYDEINKQYTNEQIANIIEENTEKLQQQGISKEVISAGTEFIRTTESQGIRDIIENDLDLEEIKEKIEQGYTPNQILKSVVKETPTEKKIEVGIKLLLANKIVKTILILCVILFIYGTVLKWRIYTKAGKPGWAAIIPVYRQIVMYQVCGLSAWLMLLWLIPVFGWLAMLVIAIMKRFCLAKEFGRGSLFGFGLLFLPLIFQTILAFQPKVDET